jgi:DNA mismatch endonuclease (patch repair protein)
MADVHNRRQRSYNMSQICSRHTKPGMLVRKFLHADGYRYTLHNKNLPGRPDMFYRNTKRLYRYTVVSGTDTPAANIM